MVTPWQCKHFKIGELVHPAILAVVSERTAWAMIGPERCAILDLIREDYEKACKEKGFTDCAIVINGVFKGSTFDSSGVRPINDKDGAPLSAHKDATTFDFKCHRRDVLLKLLQANAELYKITRMEDPQSTPTWLHVEILGYKASMKVFKP